MGVNPLHVKPHSSLQGKQMQRQENVWQSNQDGQGCKLETEGGRPAPSLSSNEGKNGEKKNYPNHSKRTEELNRGARPKLSLSLSCTRGGAGGGGFCGIWPPELTLQSVLDPHRNTQPTCVAKARTCPVGDMLQATIWEPCVSICGPIPTTYQPPYQPN